MTIGAMLCIGWAGIHTWVALHHGLMYAKRRSLHADLLFAVLSVGLALHAAGGALLLDADSVAAATTARRIALTGAPIAIGGLVSLCCALVGSVDRPLVRFTWGWAALGLGANLSHQFFDASIAAPARTPLFEGAPRYFEPQLLPAAAVWSAVAIGLAAVALAPLRVGARRDPTLRILLVGVGVGVIGGAHDVITAELSLGSLHLSEHAAVLFSFLTSQVLVRRLADADEQLDLRTRELELRYRELREAQSELVRTEQLAAVGELSAVVAHEVRNPLAILKNAVAGLRKQAVDDVDRATLLDILEEEVDRLNRLVRDLLAYARPVAPHTAKVDLHALVERAIAQAGPDIPTSVDIDVDTRTGPREVEGDAELLTRALTNLVANGCQAMRDGGRLRICTTSQRIADAPAVAIAVTDTGEGMDSMVRQKASDPFFTTRPSGTGLGLTIVERVIRAHGGTIDIDSAQGTGTRVTLLIPLTAPKPP